MATIGYRVATFNDCEDAAASLKAVSIFLGMLEGGGRMLEAGGRSFVDGLLANGFGRRVLEAMPPNSDHILLQVFPGFTFNHRTS